MIATNLIVRCTWALRCEAEENGMVVDGAVVAHSWVPGEEEEGDAAKTKKKVSASLLDTSTRHR